MNDVKATPSSEIQRRHARAAIAIWLIFAVWIFSLVLLGIERSVTRYYRDGATRWTAGQPLYDGSGTGFIYLPPSAALYTVWTSLPHATGEIVWRAANLALLALGVYRLFRMLAPNRCGTWLLITSPVFLLVAYGAIRNGQATIAVTGCMLLAATALAAKRNAISATWLSFGFALKPIMLVPILLFAPIHPRLWKSLAIGMTLVFLVPFLTQSPSYVAQQYRDSVFMLRDVDSEGQVYRWAQLFGLLHVAGIDLSPRIEEVLQASAAVATFAVAFLSKNTPPARHAFYLVSLASLYLMLFSSRTEGNTYAMLSPTLAVLFANAIEQRKKIVLAILVLAAACISGNYEIGRLLISNQPAIWLAPIGAILVAISLTEYAIASAQSDRRIPATPDEQSHGADAAQRRPAAA